jgi:hypothetical protein
MSRRLLSIFIAMFLALSLAGCQQNRGSSEPAPTSTSDSANPENADAGRTDDEIRQDAREAGREAGKNARAAGEKIREGARELGDRASAAAQGVREGWKEGDTAVNVNTASEATLEESLGLTDTEAKAVIANRPYGSPDELKTKYALSDEKYNQIAGKITVK